MREHEATQRCILDIFESEDFFSVLCMKHVRRLKIIWLVNMSALIDQIIGKLVKRFWNIEMSKFMIGTNLIEIQLISVTEKE